VLLAIAILTLVGSLVLGAPRQRRWPTAPRVAVRTRSAPDRSARGRSGAGGPSVFGLVLVACRGPSRPRRDSPARRRRRPARSGAGRRLGAAHAVVPVAVLVERALATIAGAFDSGWANLASPLARG